MGALFESLLVSNTRQCTEYLANKISTCKCNYLVFPNALIGHHLLHMHNHVEALHT